MSARLAQIAVLVTIASGCYGATPAVGLPCSESGECPEGQECDVARDVCVLIGTVTELDAGAEDASEVDASVVVDAVPDAPPVTGPPQFRSFSAVNAVTNTMTVTSPPGTVTGDLLLAHVSADSTTFTQIQAPNGWTRITGVNGDNAHCNAAFYRFAADPAATFAWTFPNTSGAIRLMAFSNVDLVNPIDVFASDAMLQTATPTAPSITTTQANTLLVVLFTQDVSNLPLDPVPSMTPLYSEDVGQIVMLGAYTPRPTAGATGPRSTTTTDPGPTTTISLALAPN